MTKILVDADACPVKQIIIKVAREQNLPVMMVMDTSHLIDDGYSEIVVVDKSRDSVDIALINRTSKGDIVVSQDYGVAAMAISKGAYSINQNGLIYTDENIDKLLFERHLAQKVRRSGKRTGGPKKRTREDDMRFESAFLNIIKKAKLQEA
ncbi:MAG: YaiI/YqxD family protein [Clostridia bacterium]|nr:YaiI/YqxD family protein [Clostridia bacterium]